MFGFVKEIMFIGLVSSTVGKMVKIRCGTDYIKELSVKQQNTMADETIKIVERAQGRKITEIDESTFDDLIVVGFMMLANELGAQQAVKHQMVLIGLMNYLNIALEKNAKITPSILLGVRGYLDKHRMG